MKIFIASDHGGFELKNKLTEYLQKQGFNVTDMGPAELTPADDYPDYALPVIKQVQESVENKGILICRNGVGESILANKFKGIRCALSWNPKHAASSRNDDNANILALPADYITDEEARQTAISWLNTPFSNEERHNRRLQKVDHVLG